MSKIINVTWEEVMERLKVIDNPGNVVYGVPKGGMIATGFLQKAKRVYRPEEANIILDDIVASGSTRDKYRSRFPKATFFALYEEVGPGEWVIFPWEADHPTGKTDTVQDNITRIIQFIGEDTEREGLKETPNRIASMFNEVFQGYNQSPEDILTTFDTDGYDQIIVCRGVEMYSICEHHMLPFFGTAHVAYIPDERVIGISKLARLVDIYARRLQIQERIGEQVTQALMQYLKPKGAACIINAVHMCMRMRGCSKQQSTMVTSSVKGVFFEDGRARKELMDLIQMG